MFYTWSGVREGKILGKRRPVNIGSVKFVSAITDEFSNKRNGGQFFSLEKTTPGGSSIGGFGRGTTDFKTNSVN